MAPNYLGRDEGLLLLDNGLMNGRSRKRRLLGSPDVLLRGGREVGVPDAAGRLSGRSGGLGGGGTGRGLTTTEQLLGLGAVVAEILLGDLRSLARVRGGNPPELLGLGVDDTLRVLNVVVDQLLVGGVDQRHGEDEGGADKGESPVRDDLNEPVRKEGANGNLWRIMVSSGSVTVFLPGKLSGGGAYRSGGGDVLGENDTLGLDDEEVDQLVDITDDHVEGLAGDGVVSAGTKLTGNTSIHDSLAGNLGGDGNAQDHPRKLEAISQHVEVPNREDESDDGHVGDRGSTCVGCISTFCSRAVILRCPARPCISGSRGSLGLDLYVRGLFHDRSSEKKEW